MTSRRMTGALRGWKTTAARLCRGFILCAAAASAFAQDLPKGLEHLAPFAADENRLADELRAFEKAQTALAQSELDAAKASAQQGDKEQAEAKRSAARARMDQLQAGYEWALTRYSQNARLHNYYGELLYDWMGDLDGGVRQWFLALQSDPRHANAHNNLGIHFFHNGDYRKGLEHLDRALELDPKNPDFLFNAAQAYLVHGPQIQDLRHWKKEKVYHEAMKLSRKAAELDPEDFTLQQDYAVNFFAAQNFGVTPKWKDAARAWQIARKKAPEPVTVFYTWMNEARVWLKVGDKTQARACLQEALRLQPDSAVVKELLEGIDAAQENRKEAPASRQNFGKRRPSEREK